MVRGRLEVVLGEQTRLVESGEEVSVPARTPHAFRALVPDTQVLTVLDPGHGFEAMLEDTYALFDDGIVGPGGIADVDAFQACLARHRDVIVSLRLPQKNA